MTDRTLCLRKLSSATFLLLFLIYNEISCIVSYQYLNNSSSDNLLNDDQNLTLESTFQNYIALNHFCDYSICKEMYEMADYPYNKILDSINININLAGKKSTSYAQEEIFNISTALLPRMGSLQPQAAPTLTDSYGYSKPISSGCKEVYNRVYPIRGIGSDGKEYFIVNVKDFQQRIDTITCHKKGTTCGDKSTTPENSVYRCKQKLDYVELTTFPVGQNITTNMQGITKFKIASGCYCERVRVYDDD